MSGCLLGGLLGDAAGAVLEFLKRPPTRDQVDRSMTLPGGGMLNVAPGQVTDDGELMLALLTAADVGDDCTCFPSRAVARRYIEWHRSMPFDIGMTCARAFAFSVDDADMSDKAARFNALSESNGAAMRCAPIAVWGVCRGMDIATIEAYARADARLSHPSPACQEANALFCSTTAHAFFFFFFFFFGDDADDMMGASPPPSQVSRAAARCLSAIRLRFRDNRDADGKLRAWIEEADTLASSSSSYAAAYSALTNVGHVKHAVVLTVLSLHGFVDGYYVSFAQVLRDVLLAGGDTDTNACICVFPLLSALCSGQ